MKIYIQIVKNIERGRKMGNKILGKHLEGYADDNNEDYQINHSPKITITIQKEIYKKLAQMKLDRDLKTFDEVLTFILNNQNSKNAPKMQKRTK